MTWLEQIKARLEASTPGGEEYKRASDNEQLIAKAPTDIANLLKAIQIKDEALKGSIDWFDGYASCEEMSAKMDQIEKALHWTPEKDEK